MPIHDLLDGNVGPMYKSALLQRQPDLVVWAVGDPGTPSAGASDPDILCWCENHHYILVTNNRKSMPAPLADHVHYARHVPGILTLNSGMSVGETIEDLLLIAEASNDLEYQDQIVYLPIT